MTDKPTRRLWQIHLSTLIVWTLVTGAVIGANIYAVKMVPTFWEDGLPLPAYSRDALYYGNLGLRMPGHKVVNVVLNLLFCFGMAGAWEQFVRRRKPQP